MTDSEGPARSRILPALLTALGGGEAGGFWLITAIVVAMGLGAAVILRKIDWI